LTSTAPPPPSSVTTPPPSIVVFVPGGIAISLVTAIVAAPPQSNVTTPPLATATDSACSVHDAAVPVPTTVVGLETLTGWMAACTWAAARRRRRRHGQAPDREGDRARRAGAA
jgi:hypothetical protein